MGFLDRPDAGGEGAAGGNDGVMERDAWVSLGHPVRWAGGLLDEASFEGAWMEEGGTACFRVGGRTSRAAAPALGSQDEVRRWLAERLAALRDGTHAEAPGATDGRDAMAA